jgi:hypothetical protein
MRHARLISVIVALLAAVAFAAWRVRPYLYDPYANEKKEREQLVRLHENSAIPEYDEGILVENAGLLDRLDGKVQASFQSMPSSHRPNSSDSDAIRKSYMGFITRNLTGTRHDLLNHYEQRGYKPYSWLAQEDSIKADNAWQASVAWLRYAPFEVESLRIEIRQLKGSRITPPRYIAAPIRTANIEAGTLYGLLEEPNQQYTAYEFFTTHIVPNRDGKSEFPVTICVTIANAGLGGSWDVIATTHTGIPEGKLFSLPYP